MSAQSREPCETCSETDADELATYRADRESDIHADPLLVAGTYRLLGRIGVGAMGVVYEAEHVRLGRRFAVKLLRADAELTSRAVRTFLREARIVATVQSPHVVEIVDCGQMRDGTPFLVTELLRGQDLRQRLVHAGRLSVREAVRIAQEACIGLAAVHTAAIVHRDLKPANLFLARDASSGRVTCKLLDFGVAKLTSYGTTEHCGIVGTVRYMAPEQILDASNVGSQADIYSIGAILYESLTGETPHTGSTAQAIMFKAVHSPAPDIAALRADLAPGLCDVIGRALNPDPTARFADAAAFANALEPWLNDRLAGEASRPTDVVGDDEPSRPPEAAASRFLPRARSAVASGLVGAMLSAAAFLAGFNRSPAPATPLAAPRCAIAPSPSVSATRSEAPASALETKQVGAAQLPATNQRSPTSPVTEPLSTFQSSASTPSDASGAASPTASVRPSRTDAAKRPRVTPTLAIDSESPYEPSPKRAP